MYNASEASPINDTILDVLVNALDLKQWAYVRAEIDDATRVQFMSSIFERVAYMFKDEDADKTPSHKSIRDRVRPYESKMIGSDVNANGSVDFRITRGNKTIVAAKNENLKEGSTQRILGMEMAADNTMKSLCMVSLPPSPHGGS
ncbi:hypothetical protein GQ600_12807 [Phytophthora cactorum]|nr:hypothetical protein GQ600_12807 [Phytophthora cactorum]